MPFRLPNRKPCLYVVVDKAGNILYNNIEKRKFLFLCHILIKNLFIMMKAYCYEIRRNIMKKFIKAAALLLSLLMCISVLTACDEAGEGNETVIDKSKLSGEPMSFSVNYTMVTSYYIDGESDEGAVYVYELTEKESERLCEILNGAVWMEGTLPEEVNGKNTCRIYTEGKTSTDRPLMVGDYFGEGVFRDWQNKCIALLSAQETKEFNDILDDAHKRTSIKEPLAEKPVIYLYPETDTACSVRVDIDGELTCTYPEHGEDGWQGFTAKSDGTLVFPDGREYYCLYWEGLPTSFESSFEKGFCVKGSESAEFLNFALLELGLTPREANEFIIYWLPKLEANEYNLLSFQFDNYASSAPLEITPTPDSILRVFLSMKPLNEYVEIEPQQLPEFERRGFTVVEWGGTWVE